MFKTMGSLRCVVPLADLQAWRCLPHVGQVGDEGPSASEAASQVNYRASCGCVVDDGDQEGDPLKSFAFALLHR